MMNCVAPVRRILNDKVGSSKDVKSSSVTEEMFISHQDQSHQTDKEPLSSPFPPLPHVHSSSLSPVSSLSDEAYLQAAGIFQRLRTEKQVTHQVLHYAKKTDTPLPESGDKTTQRQAYQLAFNTLKYQDLLEDIMMDSCFHISQHISGNMLPLALVMLFDFQDRRFLLRERSTTEGEEPHHEVRDLESSLYRCKTKLAASLARCRVKQNLQSVSCILSPPVRTKQHRAKVLPLYAWVNTLKTSVEEVCEALRSDGLREVRNMSDISELTFCRDPLCPDTLIFSQHRHALLQHSSLTMTHGLNIQDRSVCVAVTVLRPLLFDNSDVLVVGSFSAMTVAHIALGAAHSGRVLVCGADHTPSQVEEIQELLTQMDIKNVRVLSEAFCSLDEWDAAVQRLKVIIVLPQCSSSALNDPVPTIHCEHGDWDLLQDLSHGSVSQSKMQTLTNQQARLLAHALTFPKVQTVVYCTRSVYPEENEQLVKRMLEKAHTHPRLLPFRVNGPIFPDDTQSGDTTDSKFFRLESSQFTNGCFVARLSRQADPTKVETVQDVLARAAAKGLLGGIIPDQSKAGKKGKSKKNRAASATSKHSSPSSQEGPAQTGSELESGQDPVAHSDHEEEKGEGDVKCSVEEEEEGNTEDKGGNGERKRRGLKGRKRKLKRRSNRIPTVSKYLPKSHKKKPKKKKQAHHKWHLQGPTKSKPRRIPRLTLTFISSSAKPSTHLSPITAQDKSGTLTSAGKHPSPGRPAPLTALHTSSKQQVQKQNTEPERAEKTPKDTVKPGSLFKGHMKVVRPEKELKPAGFVLPPISSSTSSSLSSSNGASPSQPPSTTPHTQHTITSASSSSVSLPSLDKVGV
ncbi:putative methyltransferase NSUN7 [Thunnus albacares]|uniref:putative methyltransferase NSUN7 n=1 Tax=Thunnus albacares TaxID=8236 RepID=UPI001CF6180D|nr:putative methyltransferase NSUN7 [Thunnus albacares]